jgi:hypothetical protein
MTKTYFFLLLILLSNSIFSQVIVKPVGCFAGTNGTNSAVLSHPETRGVLVTEKWSNIEQILGVYDFTTLDNKINTVKGAGLKYSLAIPAGAFGSPDWLIDSLNVTYHSFQYQNQTWRLPLWWDPVCSQKLTDLITQIGIQYASDTMLSHVYISQMTVNGVEGHLNGVNMSAFTIDGFTDQKWIASAKSTSYEFANAFPDKPIVFEVHEINQDTIIPATIISDLTNDPNLCNRVGLGMWWISGKTTYQPDLIDFINNFQGDKYAQIIGRSDQPERFKDSLYSSVFTQAKDLNIRYIEPWPYEFQHHTHDSLIQDFNMWTDANFLHTDTCSYLTTNSNPTLLNNDLIIYPNPTNGSLNIKIDFPYKQLKITIFNLNRQEILTATNRTELDISHFPKGLYFIKLKIDNKIIDKKFIIVE